MNWDQILVSWKQLNWKFALQRFRAIDDNCEALDPSSAKMSRGGHTDPQPDEFRPDDRAKRSEFSLHIGC